MTKLIGPKFCEGLHMSPGKVYGGSTFKTFAIYYKIRFFAFVLQCTQRENVQK